MASLGAWAAAIFAGLWLGTVLALVSKFALDMTALGIAFLLVVALLVVSLAFRSMRAAGMMLLALVVVGGLALATALWSS